jgi:hypothetical protein
MCTTCLSYEPDGWCLKRFYGKISLDFDIACMTKVLHKELLLAIFGSRMQTQGQQSLNNFLLF